MPVAPKVRKKRSWPLTVSLLGLGLTLLLWFTAEYIAEHTWFTTLLTYAPPLFLAFPTAVLLLYSLLLRDLRAVLANLLASVFVLFVALGFALPHTPALSDSAPHLRVMTYNIEHGAAGVDKVVAQIRLQSPDVICLEECNAFSPTSSPYPLLQKALPDYRFTEANETVIATRLPIRKVKTTQLLKEGSRLIVEMETEVQGKPVTILAVHLATAATPDSLRSHKRSLPGYLHQTADARAEQVEQILAEVKGITTPIILCGDFNTPPRGIFYRHLTEYFTDAFANRGSGFGWTFPSKTPCLRIDYAFTRQGAVPQNAFVPKTQASDHRPLVVDIALL